jgi:hypothetical protein
MRILIAFLLTFTLSAHADISGFGQGVQLVRYDSLPNGDCLGFRDSGGVPVDVVCLDSSDDLNIGDATGVDAVNIRSGGSVTIYGSSANRGLVVQQTGAQDAVFIDHDVNTNAIEIDSEATSSNVIQFNSPATTTGIGIAAVTFDSLTTGSALSAASNSADTSTRSVAQFVNDNVLATGATVATFQQDAALQAITIDQGASSSFLDFVGNADATTTDPVSTNTTAGALQGFLQIEVNGTKYWLPFYADPS